MLRHNRRSLFDIDRSSDLCQNSLLQILLLELPQIIISETYSCYDNIEMVFIFFCATFIYSYLFFILHLVVPTIWRLKESRNTFGTFMNHPCSISAQAHRVELHSNLYRLCLWFPNCQDTSAFICNVNFVATLKKQITIYLPCVYCDKITYLNRVRQTRAPDFRTLWLTSSVLVYVYIQIL